MEDPLRVLLQQAYAAVGDTLPELARVAVVTSGRVETAVEDKASEVGHTLANPVLGAVVAVVVGVVLTSRSRPAMIRPRAGLTADLELADDGAVTGVVLGIAGGAAPVVDGLPIAGAALEHDGTACDAIDRNEVLRVARLVHDGIPDATAHLGELPAIEHHEVIEHAIVVGVVVGTVGSTIAAAHHIAGVVATVVLDGIAVGILTDCELTD